MQTDFVDRIKSIATDWGKVAVLASFVVYVFGYLALRFHLTVFGLSTDLSVLDERYLFTGARFLVYFVTAVTSVAFVLVLPALLVWFLVTRLPGPMRASLARRLSRSAVAIACLVSLLMIQLVMKNAYRLHDLLLARELPMETPWLVALLFDEPHRILYFDLLTAACLVPIGVLGWVRTAEPDSRTATAGRVLLGCLAAIQLLLLSINYGVLEVDHSLPRVTMAGPRALAVNEVSWIVWEGKEGVTYLVVDRAGDRRVFVTYPRLAVPVIEITGVEPIVPALFAVDGKRRVIAAAPDLP